MEEFITACPRNCYSTCSFRVQVENNRIRRILPYNDNLATPEGPCIKGLSYIERFHSPDRIIYPLIRSADGTFQQISTSDVLDLIAEKLIVVREKYGPHSVLWYKGSGMSGLTNDIGSEFWKAFGGATTTYGNLCWPAGLEAVRLTMGSVKHNVPWDLVNAKTIIIWGKNPAETNIQEIVFIAKARENGCKVIVIDPLRTPTADKADMLFSPVPGTDGALALAIASVLIEKGLIDLTFLNNYVKGFDEFKQSLKITPAEAEKITGIPASDIIELAGLIGEGGPVTFLPGYGLQRHLNGGQTIRSILSLAVLTGNIGKSGAGFNYANLQSYVFDDLKEPLSYYPDPLKDAPYRRTLSMAKVGADMLKTTNPELKAAWIERGNPLLQSPDSVNVRKTFEGIGFKVVVDQFMTDTAKIADVILPAKDMFEQSDIIGSYWSPYVQYKPKVIESPGEVMPETEIYYHLAKRMDLKINNSLLPEPGNENIERWLEERIKGYSHLSLKDLKSGPVLAPGLQEIAWSDMKFDTPSGKIELYSEEAKLKWGISQLPQYISQSIDASAENYPLTFITPNTGSRIHSQFGNLKIIKESVPEPAAGISVADAKKRNISTGDRIRIFNQIGEIISFARVTNRIPKGSVVLPNGIWYGEGGGGNTLIEGRETDMGYGAAFHDNKVEVERIL
ncbi:MAG: molybdopterin-dependent oxidoreductase [Bacteroidales bacterium]|nr:molybdopterin-dependent oxidoreductase [Bacteroidales bacterium]